MPKSNKSNEQTIKEANEKISKAIDEAMKQIKLAESIADEHALTFSWDLAYGMGGFYSGKGTKSGYRASATIRDEGEWVSSSSGC